LLQLENVLRFAGKHSPFYRDSLKFLDRLPSRGLSEEHFSSLPILTRQDLQEHAQEIDVRSLPANHGTSRTISGASTTGQPIKVMTTGLMGVWDRAMTLRGQDWHGRDTSLSNLDIRDSHKQERKKPGRWSDLPWSGPSTALSVDQPIEDLFDDFIRMKPDYLQTSPFILQPFVELSIARGIKPQNLREVCCQIERLSPEVRDMAEKAWGVPITDIYSAMEIGIMAHQCPDNYNLHIQSEYVRLEVLGDDNKPCQAGEVGRIIVTPLHNYQTPLIRYAIGDYAEVGGPCSCGRSLPVLTRILGHEKEYR
jgi:phenylacetate-CoA ligase